MQILTKLTRIVRFLKLKNSDGELVKVDKENLLHNNVTQKELTEGEEKSTVIL